MRSPMGRGEIETGKQRGGGKKSEAMRTEEAESVARFVTDSYRLCSYHLVLPAFSLSIFWLLSPCFLVFLSFPVFPPVLSSCSCFVLLCFICPTVVLFPEALCPRCPLAPRRVSELCHLVLFALLPGGHRLSSPWPPDPLRAGRRRMLVIVYI